MTSSKAKVTTVEALLVEPKDDAAVRRVPGFT
jgi:hypothetical protein